MENITIKQFISLPQSSQNDAVLSSLKPNNFFAGSKMSIGTMPYANVKFAIRLLSKIDSWDTMARLFEICFDVAASDFWSANIVEYYQARAFMLSEFQRVINTESKMMASQSTDEHLWVMAGADRLKPYSDTLPLIQLGKLFGLYPFDIGRKPYNEVFNMLVQIKVQNEVETEYQKLKSK
jgi:hypothetical protein